VRGEVRRPRARFAAARSGRLGAPPPVITNRREELADGEALWPHEKRGPGRETAALERCEAPASRRREANGRPIAP